MVITRLQCKLATVGGVSLDEDTTSDLSKVMEEEDQVVKEIYPEEDCFQRIFWQQQKEASLRSGRGFAGTYL